MLKSEHFWHFTYFCGQKRQQIFRKKILGCWFHEMLVTHLTKSIFWVKYCDRFTTKQKHQGILRKTFRLQSGALNLEFRNKLNKSILILVCIYHTNPANTTAAVKLQRNIFFSFFSSDWRQDIFLLVIFWCCPRGQRCKK